MIKLTDHINQNHGGNKAAFARSIGVRPQGVNDMLKAKKPYFADADGNVYQLTHRKKGSKDE